MKSLGKRKSFLGRRKASSGEVSLQITSMADIFTILLVFLLKGYATGAVNITPAKGTILPQAHAGELSFEALKIEISEDAVQIEGAPAVALKKYLFEAQEIQGNGVSKSMSSALEKERKRQLAIAKSNSDVQVDSRVIIVSDRQVPYSTLKSVLASAAVHGYTDFKLAVAQE